MSLDKAQEEEGDSIDSVAPTLSALCKPSTGTQCLIVACPVSSGARSGLCSIGSISGRRRGKRARPQSTLHLINLPIAFQYTVSQRRADDI